MQADTARQAAIDILRDHDMSLGRLLCSIFVEIDKDGIPKEPLLISLIQNGLVVIRRSVRKNYPHPFIRYRLLSLNNINLTVNCVHFKKMTIDILDDDSIYMMLSKCKCRGKGVDEIWKKWVEAAVELQRRTYKDMDRYDYKGTITLNCSLNDPFRDYCYLGADAYPFDQCSFLKWLQKP